MGILEANALAIDAVTFNDELGLEVVGLLGAPDVGPLGAPDVGPLGAAVDTTSSTNDPNGENVSVTFCVSLAPPPGASKQMAFPSFSPQSNPIVKGPSEKYRLRTCERSGGGCICLVVLDRAQYRSRRDPGVSLRPERRQRLFLVRPVVLTQPGPAREIEKNRDPFREREE
ncbi:hypothetical protein B0H19DRAFT_1062079 [Mycena capillaripes]|nr:hypothetical protein B0H19DRAFT_1062079 [Mycena capillaripes]